MNIQRGTNTNIITNSSKTLWLGNENMNIQRETGVQSLLVDTYIHKLSVDIKQILTATGKKKRGGLLLKSYIIVRTGLRMALL